LALYTLAWESDSTNPVYLYYMASILDNNLHRTKDAMEVYQQYTDVVNGIAKEGNWDKHQISILTIVQDRIECLKEELFFRDED